MLRPLPNWFHGLLPGSLWPDRPREFYAYTLNLIPLAAGATVTTDVVFSKKTDTIIFGGMLLRTTTTGDTFFSPRPGADSVVELGGGGTVHRWADSRRESVRLLGADYGACGLRQCRGQAARAVAATDLCTEGWRVVHAHHRPSGDGQSFPRHVLGMSAVRAE